MDAETRQRLRFILRWIVVALFAVVLLIQFVPAFIEWKTYRVELMIFCLAGVLGYQALEPKKQSSV